VICSTSLELGIDIGAVDLVVMLASPKGVTKALQRTGRSGHDLRRISRGLLMATNVNDLVECCATALLARTGHLDRVRLPVAPLDVLAQHLVSMGCTRRWPRREAFDLVRQAVPYRDLDPADFERVLDYLAGGGQSLRAAYSELFGKIQLEADAFETRPGVTRRDFLQNVGVIPNVGVVRVNLRARSLGTVEESFARRLQPGDVFMLAGQPLRVNRHGWMEVFVKRAPGAAPTVPRWNANKFPLSNRVASEIVAFRSELRARIDNGTSESALAGWVAERLDCGANNARIVLRTHLMQHRVSELPTADFLLVEEFASEVTPPDSRTSAPAMTARDPGSGHPTHRGRTRRSPSPLATATAPRRHYAFHALIGRAGNDALSRVVARRLNRLRGGSAVATADDYGFLLTVAATQSIDPSELLVLLAPEGFADDLDAALARSELLKYHFRNAAQTGLMVYRNFFGEQKPVRKLQFSSEVIFNVLVEHEPDHVLLREARRDAVHAFLDRDVAVTWLRGLKDKPIRLRRLTGVPPLAFSMYASGISEAVGTEDPAETLERLYHLWWQRLQHER
jgi:ATP-dependent Lhr-like helicase